MKKKSTFKRKPINDCPEEFKRLVKLAKEGSININDEYPNVNWDYPGYYLAIHLGDYFKSDHYAAEELKSILYDHRDIERDDDRDRFKDLVSWLHWYFPKMMKLICRGITHFVRGFKIGLPGALIYSEKAALNALKEWDNFLNKGSRYWYRGLDGRAWNLEGYTKEYEFLLELMEKCPFGSKTPLDWNPIVERDTRWGMEVYKEKGLTEYAKWKRQFILADNQHFPLSEIDESRILPPEIMAKVRELLKQKPIGGMFQFPVGVR